MMLLIVVRVLLVLRLTPAVVLLRLWYGNRTRSVGNWSASHAVAGLAAVASASASTCTALHGWLPSRQVVAHLAGLGANVSQW